jgi:serine/threonine protein kinase
MYNPTNAVTQGLIVRCPACGSRLRLQPGRELPDRFKVRCSSCGKPFLVRRRDEGQRANPAEPLDRTLTGEKVPTSPLDDQPTHLNQLTASPPQTQRPSGPARAGPPPLGGDLPRKLGTTFVPGELVAGRYRIERFIAKGGMGEVYEAFDTALEDNVALKTSAPTSPPTNPRSSGSSARSTWRARSPTATSAASTTSAPTPPTRRWRASTRAARSSSSPWSCCAARRSPSTWRSKA